MSVIMTLKFNGSPERFQETAKVESERLGRILEVAQSHGVMAHRWYSDGDGFMVVDEWPDAASFQAFFDAAGNDIGPLMEAAGITDEPELTFWRKMESGDELGWGA